MHTKLKILGCLLWLFSAWQLHAQTIQLTSPNGGETWVGGSTRTITWSYTNIDNIKIEYSLNNGLTWKVISESTPASALSYNWVVPCIGSLNAKVRVTSTLQFVQDESNGTFTIPEPTVDITYPNGGEAFGTGTGQYIEWLTTGVTTLKVQYTTNNGSTWTDIGNFPAANGYCNWVAPITTSTQTRIRAYNIESTVNRDSSANQFSVFYLPEHNTDKYKGGPQDGYNMASNLPDTIRVISPNGGESLYPTTTTIISWSYRNIDNIKLEYSTDNGSNWKTIVSEIPASQLNYNWSIPNTPSSECLIKISSTTKGINDVSNAKFTIAAASLSLTYPNGGESFGAGTGQYIEWDFSSVSTVKVEYSSNNGTSWNTIGTAPAANKYMNWVTPSSVGTNYLVRISDNSLPAVKDSSENIFSITSIPIADQNKYKGGVNDGYSMNSSLKDSIKIVSPNGGEIWPSASQRMIKWTYCEVDNISIDYSLNDGTTWKPIIENIPASQLSYNWTVPTIPSFTCRIRIRDVNRPISDISDSAFIIPTSMVEIRYPNGGEKFKAGSGQYIEWTSKDLASVKLEYSLDNGSNWSVIGVFPAANQYANWVVPTTVSSQIFLRISDVENPTFYVDQTNGAFSSERIPNEDVNKYKGGEGDGYSMYAFKDSYLQIRTPNGGEIFGNGTIQKITWKTLNTLENIVLDYSIDNEKNWTLLLNDVSPESNSYDWTISSPVSTFCKVRIRTVSGILIDKSDNFFIIANPNGIITKNLNKSVFCSKEQLNVDFTINSNFNLGNKFIVQLSDSVGSFNSKIINVGEIESTIAKSIPVQLPSIYSNSSLYRIRVISTNPPTLGTNNGSNFTINPLPSVQLGNDTALCLGHTITLNALNSGSTYIWNTGATTPSISVNKSGNYIVSVTNACGTSRDTIKILQKELPTVNLGNDTTICLNSSIKLSPSSTNEDDTFLWSTGSNSPSIMAVIPGTYTLTVSNQCGTVSDQIMVTTKSPINVQLGASTALCEGKTLGLDAGNAGASYLWSSGETTQKINVSKPGKYWVNVTDLCGTVSGQIAVIDGSFVPTITGPTSACVGDYVVYTVTGANSYTWNTGQLHSQIAIFVTGSSSFNVTAKNIYGCTVSKQFNLSVFTPPIITGPSTLCFGSKAIFKASVSGGTWGVLNDYMLLSSPQGLFRNNKFPPTNMFKTGVTYTVTSKDKKCTATATKNVWLRNVSASSISLTAPKQTIKVGEQVVATASTKIAGNSIVWMSASTSFVSVSGTSPYTSIIKGLRPTNGANITISIDDQVKGCRNAAFLPFTVTSAASLVSKDSDRDYSIVTPIVYPNPSSGLVNIENLGDATTVSLVDITGRILQTNTDLKEGMQIDYTKISKGNYIISIQGQTMKEMQPITIE